MKSLLVETHADAFFPPGQRNIVSFIAKLEVDIRRLWGYRFMSGEIMGFMELTMQYADQ